MSIEVHRRLRIADIDPAMKDLRGMIEEARRQNWRRRLVALIIGGVVVGAALAAAFTFDFDDGCVNLCLPVGALVVAGLIYARLDQGSRIAREAAKVEFVGEVLAGLAPDVHPKTRIKMKLDLRRYHVPDKLTWTGESIAGHEKNKYADRWLHLDCALADHTRVQIKQRAGIKTKTGNIIRESRRFFLVVRPSARYDPAAIARDAEVLRKRLKEALHGLFKNVPEAGHVYVEPRGGELCIGVRQEDAPILAVEIIGLLDVVMHFLSRRVRRRAT